MEFHKTYILSDPLRGVKEFILSVPNWNRAFADKGSEQVLSECLLAYVLGLKNYRIRLDFMADELRGVALFQENPDSIHINHLVARDMASVARFFAAARVEFPTKQITCYRHDKFKSYG